MTIRSNITKIGNSTYVLIPALLCKEFNLKNGDFVEIKVENDRLTITVERKEVKK